MATRDSPGGRVGRSRTLLQISCIALFLGMAYVVGAAGKLHTAVPFIRGDCFYYRAMIESMLEDGDLYLQNNVGNRDPVEERQLALGKTGDVTRLVPKHPILFAAIAAPFYFVAGNAGLLAFNILQTIVLMAVLFLLCRLFCGEISSLVTVILTGTATLFYDYSYNFSADVLGTVFVLSAIYFVYRKNLAFCGLLLGLATFLRITNALFILPLVVVFAIEISRESNPKEKGLLKSGAAFVASFAVPVTLMLVANSLLYGDALTTGYHRAVGPGLHVDNHVGNFNQPFFRGLINLLLDSKNGLLPTNVPVALSVLVVTRAARHKLVRMWPLLTFVVTQLVTFAKYDDWATSHFSNRFLMPTVCILSVFVAAALDAHSEFAKRIWFGDGGQSRDAPNV